MRMIVAASVAGGLIMLMPNGKGMYIWQLEELCKGDIHALLDLCQALGLDWVAVRLADGATIDNEHSTQGAVAFSKLIHAAGLQFWGWQAIYGYYPVAEATLALTRIKQTESDGFIIDAESAFKRSGGATAALKYMKTLCP